MNGILIVDKPQDFTSFDVVAVLRKILCTKKIGHGGTLDPLATGVLPIFIGNATKIIDVIPNQDKKYIASFKLGISTSTYDISGEILEEKKSFVPKELLLESLNHFIGQINQIPPMYSAIKINGQKLYHLARQGKQIERPARTITIYDLKLLDFNPSLQEGIIEVLVSKGTYIRALINDIGKILNVGATMTSLRRTQALGFDISKSYKIEEIKNLKNNNQLNSIIISPETALPSLPKQILSDEALGKIINGQKIKINLEKNIYYKVYNSSNEFFGIGFYKEDEHFKFKYISK